MRGSAARSLLERFEAKYIPEPTSGCWLWIGADSGAGGYGVFWDGARLVKAHRWSYERFVGPIPPRLFIDHLCRVRCCVNPHHLEPVTNRENVMRGIGPTQQNSQKVFCKRGHRLDSLNSRMTVQRSRLCLICQRMMRPTVRPSRATLPRDEFGRRAYCMRGHRFDHANTIFMSTGKRLCRECNRTRCATAYRKRQASEGAR